MLVCKVEVRIPYSTVHQLSLEVVQPRDSRISPGVQNTACIDQDIA